MHIGKNTAHEWETYLDRPLVAATPFIMFHRVKATPLHMNRKGGLRDSEKEPLTSARLRFFILIVTFLLKLKTVPSRHHHHHHQ